jgi:hypothetical protein
VFDGDDDDDDDDDDNDDTDDEDDKDYINDEVNDIQNKTYKYISIFIYFLF